MGLLSDLRVLYHLAFSPIRGKTHAERLESFYGGQAGAYDDFRKRLLQGRQEMVQRLPLDPGSVWVDLGGGTGANVEFAGAAVRSLKKAYVVDLSPSLLGVARERFDQLGLNNVETVEADATQWVPEEGQADVVSFSYSLTMIPDWFRAIDHAVRLLRPCGTLGVVDFYVARKYPAEQRRPHPWHTRTFWPAWFANDNVFHSPDHVPYLESRLAEVDVDEHLAKVPYMPVMRVPYYIAIGRKG